MPELSYWILNCSKIDLFLLFLFVFLFFVLMKSFSCTETRQKCARIANFTPSSKWDYEILMSAIVSLASVGARARVLYFPFTASICSWKTWMYARNRSIPKWINNFYYSWRIQTHSNWIALSKMASNWWWKKMRYWEEKKKKKVQMSKQHFGMAMLYNIRSDWKRIKIAID